MQSSDSSITTIWLIAVFISTMHVVISFCPFPSLSLHLNSLYTWRTQPNHVRIITFRLITVLYDSFCQYRHSQLDYWGRIITSFGNFILQVLFWSVDAAVECYNYWLLGYLNCFPDFFKILLCILYWPHLISSDDVISTRGFSCP